jgi:prepilin-type N-terminal cleavage/methylation domain-containing protein
MKKGFTLIELAIVLVIISIVIGAIIGSRDLIESAKLNGIISDFKKYESAFNAFKEKYGALPGDMPDASDVFTVPDSNCAIDYNGYGNNDIVLSGESELANGPGDWEVYTAMDMLSKAGFIDFKANQTSLNCTNIISGSDQVGIRYPESTVKNAGFYFNYTGSFNAITTNLMHFASSSQSYNTPFDGAITPSEAQIIDKRIDDGLAMKGKLSGYESFQGNCMTYSEGDTYNTTSKLKECTLIYDIENRYR